MTSLSDSLWAETAPLPVATAPLEGEIETDVLVVGGGYTGLSCALHLAQQGADAVVVEAEQIGFGGSGRNVGLVNAGLWLPPDEVENRMGKCDGEKLNAVLGYSPDLVFSLIKRYEIDCEAIRKGTLHLGHSGAGVRELENRCRQWQRRGAPVSLLNSTETCEKTGTTYYQAALIDKRAGTINPLAYARGLAKAAVAEGARVFTGTAALSFRRIGQYWQIETPMGSVRARALILATNAYSDDLLTGMQRTFTPIYFFQFATRKLNTEQARGILPEKQGAWDTQRVMAAMRMDTGNRLIIGSIGKLPSGSARFHRYWANRMLDRLFPDLGDIEFEFKWHGRIGFTPDHLPKIHEPMPELLTVTGYNGRGIGPGTVFGKALADYILLDDVSVLPLPLSEPGTVSCRFIRESSYELAARAYHVFC